MIDEDSEYFLDELEEVTNLAYDTGYADFPKLLERWFYLISDAPDSIASIMNEVISSTTIDSVMNDMLVEQIGIGNNTLNWPLDKVKRLGGQQILLRAFASTDIDYEKFVGSYFRSFKGDYNDASHEQVRKLFLPHARELDRYIRRRLEGGAIPGSDRFVPISHNQPIVQEIIAGLENITNQLAGVNDGDPDEKAMLSGELSAGRRLMQATHVRLRAIAEIVVKPLRWIAKKFVDAGIGEIASAMIALVLTYFNLR